MRRRGDNCLKLLVSIIVRSTLRQRARFTGTNKPLDAEVENLTALLELTQNPGDGLNFNLRLQHLRMVSKWPSALARCKAR